MRRLLILLAIALLIAPNAAIAQSGNRGLRDALGEIGVDWESFGSKTYTIDGMSFDTPYGYAFIGINLRSDDDAEDVIDDLPPLFNQLMGDVYGDPSLAFKRVSGGQVGEDRYGASGDLESGDYEFKIGYLMARADHYVVIGIAFGVLISPVVEVAPYVEHSLERLEDEQPDESREVTALLPQLDDMPPGYTDDDDTLTPSPTPRMGPTPTPKTTAIHLAGKGVYQANYIPLNAGSYTATFTCAGPTGSIAINWGSSGDPSVLETSTESNQGLGFYTISKDTSVSVRITCDGVWAFDVMPT